MNGNQPDTESVHLPLLDGRGTHDQPAGFAEHLVSFLRRNLGWLLAAALVMLALHDVFGTHGLLAMRRSQQEAARLQKEIQQLNDENQRMQDRVKELKSDPAAIERIAREEMGLARPGEHIFKISPNPQDNSTTSRAPDGQPAKP